MIERHIPFTVPAEHATGFEEFFAQRYRPAAIESPGLVAIGLLRALEDPTSYAMTFRWDDAESATGWRTSAAHEALQPELKSLAAMGAIQIFTVVE